MIKIFISSTFSDMQSEREIIQKNVLPKLCHFSRRIGQDVSIVDLLWENSGKEMTSDELVSKILSNCAKEIESCQPYFVLLLGDRYGTIPNDVSLKSFLKEHPEIPVEMAKNKSITEIELMLAIQKIADPSKLIVCIRNSELLGKIPQQYRSNYSDVGEKADLMALFKEKISNSSNVEVISYQADWDEEKSAVYGLNSFAEQLTDALMQQIIENIGQIETAPEKKADAFDSMTIQEAIFIGTKKFYGDYVDAYKCLDKNQSKVMSYFQKILEENQDFMEMIRLFIFKYAEKIQNKHLLLAAIRTTDVAESMAQALNRYAYKMKELEKEAFWKEQENSLHADALLYRSIKALLEGDTFITEQKKAHLVDRFYYAITDMRLFAFCIEKGGTILNKYLDFVRGKEHKHWYNIYQELAKTNHKRIKKDMQVIGRYLCEHIDELEVKRILYHSIFYESLALEYAYKNHRKDIAEKIVYNGYDHYLELSTLYILRQYDRVLYHNMINDLKRICLIRAIVQFEYFYFRRDLCNTYGSIFCDEFVKLAIEAIEKLKYAEKDDPRLSEKRKTPNWAE